MPRGIIPLCFSRSMRRLIRGFSTDKALVFLDRQHDDDGAAVLFDDDWLGASGVEQSPEPVLRVLVLDTLQ